MSSDLYPSPTVGPDQFKEIEARFLELGRRLSDRQLLDLADLYHEILRTRRCVRAAPQRRTSYREEQRSFDTGEENPIFAIGGSTAGGGRG